MSKKTLPDTVREWIDADPRNLSELARAIDVAPQTISRFVAGNRELGGELIGRLIEALGGKVQPPKSKSKK